jgi:phosphate-selective porin OprO/OprP
MRARKPRILSLLLPAVLLAGASAASAADGAGTDATLDLVADPPAQAPAEEPAKKPPPSNPTYIEGRGFDFKTADGLFDLAIGANLQVRFSDLDVEGAGEATEFRVRRFKLYLTGFAFDPRLTYRVQLAFENPNNVRLLDDLWLNWRFVDLLQIQMGQSKTPYGREELMNDGVLMFAERSIAIDAFKPNRDIGVMTLGYSKDSVFQYAAGVFGGVGQTTLRTTNHVMPIARVVWSTFGDPRVGEPDLARSPKLRMSIGANGFFDTLKKTSATAFESTFPNYAAATGWLGQNVALFQTDEDVQVGSGGIDTQVAWYGLSFQGEYLFGHAKGVTSGVNLNSRGYYAEVNAMVLPKLGLACRYSSIDSNRAVTRDQQSEINGAATWYFRKHNAKLLLEYSKLHRQRTGEPANDHFIRVQAQLYM